MYGCRIDLDCSDDRQCNPAPYWRCMDAKFIYPACTDHIDRSKCDERKNSYGPNLCRVDDDCNL